MPEEGLAVVRALIEAFNERGADLDTASGAPPDIYVDEPEIVPFRAALEGTMYSGPTAIDDFWADSRESWATLHFEADRLEPVGRGVLGVGTLTGTSRETGAPVESRVTVAVHVREGRISRFAVCASEADARRELAGD